MGSDPDIWVRADWLMIALAVFFGLQAAMGRAGSVAVAVACVATFVALRVFHDF